MQNVNLPGRTAQILSWLQNSFSQALQIDDPLDVARVAESLLPVSQLYGFEMSYLHSRDHYEK